jgi:hypothetical protein
MWVMANALNRVSFPVERICHATVNTAFDTLDDDVGCVTGGAELAQCETRGFAWHTVIVNVLDPLKVRQMSFTTCQQKSDRQCSRGVRFCTTVMNKSGSVWTPPILNQLEDPRIDGR